MAALAAIAFTPVATKADEPIELPNGVSDGSGPVPKRGDVVAVRLRGLLERRLQGRAARSS